MSRSTMTAAPIVRATGSRRAAAAGRQALAPARAGTVAYWVRCARHHAPAQPSSCRQCGRRLRPLQGEREWGLAFCEFACVRSFGRQHGRALDRTPA